MFPRIAHLVVGALLTICVITPFGTAAAAPGDARVHADKATQTLFEAVHTNDFAAAEAAVAAGANIDAKNRWSLTPVELAIDKGYFKIAHFLVSVRNNRNPADAEAAAEKPAAASRAAVSTPAQSRPRQSAAGSQALASEPAPQPWPSGKANPFDPAAPAFGAGLTIIAPAQSSMAGSGDGELLATDTPASARREYRN